MLRVFSEIRRACCSCRGPELGSNHGFWTAHTAHNSSSGDLMSFSSLYRYPPSCARTVMCIQKSPCRRQLVCGTKESWEKIPEIMAIEMKGRHLSHFRKLSRPDRVIPTKILVASLPTAKCLTQGNTAEELWQNRIQGNKN